MNHVCTYTDPPGPHEVSISDPGHCKNCREFVAATTPAIRPISLAYYYGTADEEPDLRAQAYAKARANWPECPTQPLAESRRHAVDVLAARAESAEAEAKRLTALINTPELHDFIKAVPLEAVHQRERWGSDHDDGKTPADWFWLLGYLGGKALRSHLDGDTKKALHHTITAAAALANWHSNILGKTNMRPGIADPESARTALAKREG